VLDKLTVEDFKPAVGKPFSIDAGDAGTLDLTLARVRPLRAETAPDPDERAPFALDFRGPPDPILPQAIYRLENELMGRLEIFIVPVGRTADGTDYEAIFT
jgi:hypothetical protein